MKTPFVTTIVTTVMLVAGGAARADDDDHGHYRHHGSFHSAPGYATRHGGYRHRPPRGRRHHDDDDTSDGIKIAAGALVLGTIIYALSTSQRRQQSHATPHAGPPADFWYRFDGEGRCVMARLNAEGREVWTYVDPGHCR